MILTIEKIKVYKQQRKIRVVFDFGQWAEFFPFGVIYISNTSELLQKKDLRFIGDKAMSLDYFSRHKERKDPVLYEIKAAEKELAQFVGTKVKSI